MRTSEAARDGKQKAAARKESVNRMSFYRGAENAEV
jgi:hypothetical protein